MNLHKDTDDKDTIRRGKYLNKLFDSHALAPHKSLLNRSNFNEHVELPRADLQMMKNMSQGT